MMYFARWKVTLILAVLALGTIFAIPNLLPGRINQAIPGWVPHPTVSLGLDLQGVWGFGLLRFWIHAAPLME